jgi:hypothetical protein
LKLKSDVLLSVNSGLTGEKEHLTIELKETRKLQISYEELKGYFNMPKKFYWDYKNQENIFKIGAKVLKFLGIEKSIKR